MSSEKVKGVIALCNGDRGSLFKTIEIETNHRIFTQGELSPVAKKIGLELLALQLPPETAGLVGPALDNQTATYLMIDTESGLASPKWQRSGTTLFIRKDKKPLTQNHLEALWMFNDNILGVFGDSATKAKGMMTRTEWDRFWNNYKFDQIGIIRQCSYGRDRSDEVQAWENDINPLEV